MDLFSLFAAVTFIGIAVDYGIYVVYRFGSSGRRMNDVMTKNRAAITIAAGTALVGFGTLVNSSYGDITSSASIDRHAELLPDCLNRVPAAFVIETDRWSRSAR